MVAIRSQIVPLTRRRQYLGTNKRLYVTVHETGNRTKGANAAGHANYLSGKNRPKSNSWHYTVDEAEAVQSYPDTARCFHSGGGRDNGNLNSIAIEICVNSDGDYQQAVANAAALTRILLDRHGIPLSRVVQHNHWSGKNCPTNLRNGSQGITWAGFLAMVKSGATPVSIPKPAPKPQPARPTGGSIVSQLPTLDLRNAHKTPVRGAAVGRWQALLLAAGYGPAGLVGSNGRPDNIAGAATKKLSGQFQVKHNAGNDNGKADYIVATKSWSAGLGV